MNAPLCQSTVTLWANFVIIGPDLPRSFHKWLSETPRRIVQKSGGGGGGKKRNMGGKICPPPGPKGLTDLPKIGGQLPSYSGIPDFF